MKTIRITGLTVMTVIVCGLMAACSSGDEEEENRNGASKRIVRIEHNQNDNTYVRTFTYDNQDRVIKVIKASNESSYSEINYEYGEHTITRTDDFGLTLSLSQRSTYTLSNGLIVKEVCNGETRFFTYDNEGYLSTIDSEKVVWSNGNIIRIGNRQEYKYSNITWKKMMIWVEDAIFPDIYLCQGGYWGKTPKNLPSEWVGRSPYKWEVSNGYVTKCTVKGYYEDDNYTYYWE